MQAIKSMKISVTRILTILFLLLVVAACTPATAPAPVTETTAVRTSTPALTPSAASTQAVTEIGGIGILGDSTSDEYRGDDARGGEYGETTLNWVELLAKTRGLNFGEWGTWEEPRRTGYEYNWARTGATINTMITTGQHTGLAEQVAEGKVSFVVVWIGNNDFHLKNGPYEEIYSGKLSDTDLQKKVDQAVRELTTAMETVLKAGEVKMGVVAITDQGLAPEAKIMFPDSKKRQRVTDAIASINARVREFADAHGVIMLDSNAFGQFLFSRVDMLGNFEFGGEKISVVLKGDEPHHLQLGDNIGHAGTVLSGLVANSLFVDPFNQAFGLNLSPLTEEEILQNAGIK